MRKFTIFVDFQKKSIIFALVTERYYVNRREFGIRKLLKKLWE